MNIYNQLPKNFAQVLAEYSNNFHRNVLIKPNENYISSPLCSWLLLAVLAGSSDFSKTPEDKASIENTLGFSVEEAVEITKVVLSLKTMSTAVGAWFRPNFVEKYPNVQKWLDSDELATKDSVMPSQSFLDQWASENTNGLIKKFPIEVTADAILIVAAVLYMKFSWQDPFELTLAPESEIVGATNWLSDKKAIINFFDTPEGPIVVHSKNAGTENVLSMMPLNKMDDLQLLQYAEKIQSRELKVLTLQEVLPSLEKSEMVDVTEIQSTEHRYSAVVPAWEADNKHDLGSSSFRFDNILNVLSVDHTDENDPEYAVAQSVVAKYTREGFEAAAVTAFGMFRASAFMPPQPSTHYQVDIKFANVYAVVCSTYSFIPVFTGLVKVATEA